MKILFWFGFFIGCAPGRVCPMLLYNFGNNSIFVDSSVFYKEELSLQWSLMWFCLSMSYNQAWNI